MSATELLDDLEAGELSVEFEGLEPWEVLGWALERFGDRLSLSTAFQDGDVALIDMAYRIDPAVRVFSIDTGRLPQETHDLVEELGALPGARLEPPRPTGCTCMQRPFADVDEQVELRAGCTIPTLFSEQGEPAFRASSRPCWPTC